MIFRDPFSKTNTVRSRLPLVLVGVITVFSLDAGDARAQNADHPFAGIWSFRIETGPITQRERLRACLEQPSVTHKDGVLVAWERVAKNFSLDLDKPYFKSNGFSECKVADDGIETCNDFNEDGTPAADTSALQAKLSLLPNGNLQFCEPKEGENRFETGDECAEMLACPVGLYTLNGQGWQLKLDVLKRPKARPAP